MHEGEMIQEVVASLLAALDNSRAPRVTHVQLELGTSGHFAEEAVRQYFQMFTRATPAEGAELELLWLPATYQCLSCQQCFDSASAIGICPHCHDFGLEIAHQDGCVLRSMDVVQNETFRETGRNTDQILTERLPTT
jgi:hydrogenase nickel incorporation protein HypA/HybF